MPHNIKTLISSVLILWLLLLLVLWRCFCLILPHSFEFLFSSLCFFNVVMCAYFFLYIFFCLNSVVFVRFFFHFFYSSIFFYQTPFWALYNFRGATVITSMLHTSIYSDSFEKIRAQQIFSNKFQKGSDCKIITLKRIEREKILTFSSSHQSIFYDTWKLILENLVFFGISMRNAQ